MRRARARVCPCIDVRLLTTPPPQPPPRTRAAVDPFTRKEWYDIKAPSMFAERVPGKTPVTRTTGQSAS